MGRDHLLVDALMTESEPTRAETIAHFEKFLLDTASGPAELEREAADLRDIRQRAEAILNQLLEGSS